MHALALIAVSTYFGSFFYCIYIYIFILIPISHAVWGFGHSRCCCWLAGRRRTCMHRVRIIFLTYLDHGACWLCSWLAWRRRTCAECRAAVGSQSDAEHACIDYSADLEVLQLARMAMLNLPACRAAVGSQGDAEHACINAHLFH